MSATSNGTNTPQPVEMCAGCNTNPCVDNQATDRYCADCYSDLYSECANCGDEGRSDDMTYHSNRDSSYCASCYEEVVAEDYAEEYGDWPERPYFTGNSRRYQGRVRGTIIRSMRVFSTEIECYAPSVKECVAAVAEIPQGVGISGDGSLGERGVELQTPKLRGSKGENTIKAICAALQKHDFSVDSSAGLHVHIDGRGLFPRTISRHDPKALKQLWAFYRVYEPVIHSFISRDRRTNGYCRPIANEAALTQVLAAKNLRDLEKAWYRTDRVSYIDDRKRHKYDDSRYCGVNLHSLLSAKHIEIRYHSGTIRASKILEWANLHMTILDQAAAGELDIEQTLLDNRTECTLDYLTARFFERLGLAPNSRKFFLYRQGKFADGRTKEGAVNEIAPAQITVGVTMTA